MLGVGSRGGPACPGRLGAALDEEDEEEQPCAVYITPKEKLSCDSPEAAPKEFTRHSKKKASFFFFPPTELAAEAASGFTRGEKTHIVGESPLLPKSPTHVGQGWEQEWHREGIKWLFMWWPGWPGPGVMHRQRNWKGQVS